MTDQNAEQESNDSAAPTEERLRELCGELLTGWRDAYSGIGSIDLGAGDQEPDAARFAVVLAFVAHTHHVTTAAADLMHADNYLAAIPLLRVGYESALTAAWAADSADAARALKNEYLANDKKLHDNAMRTGWFDELLTDVLAEAPADAAKSTQGQAGAFANLCKSLEPHDEWLYTMYRLLSGYSHATGTVVSAFVSEEPDGGVSLEPAPMNDTRSWWHAASTNLLHAGQALDRLDSQGRREEQLAQASEVVGWPAPLRLTESARRKVAEAAAARKGSTGRAP